MVAQSFTLLYRRIAFCEGHDPWNLPKMSNGSAECNSAVQQSETLRYAGKSPALPFLARLLLREFFRASDFGFRASIDISAIRYTLLYL
jgi:hypothetical protein